MEKVTVTIDGQKKEVNIRSLSYRQQVELELKIPRDLLESDEAVSKWLTQRRMTEMTGLSIPEYGNLSPREGMKLSNAVSKVLRKSSEDPSGELVSDGDGVDSPIHYRFGTPLVIMSGNKGKVEIKEFELQLTRYADLEDIIAKVHPPKMVFAMIEKSTPLAISGDTKLMNMPAAAIDTLKQADAEFLQEHVLPGFLNVDED